MIFASRWSYYLRDPNLTWLRDTNKTEIPANYFTLSTDATEMMWTRNVFTRTVGGKDEYVINLLNLPDINGDIESNTTIPDPATNTVIGVYDTIGSFNVYALEADDSDLAPKELTISSQAGGITYYDVPDVTCWTMLVLKEQ